MMRADNRSQLLAAYNEASIKKIMFFSVSS